MAQQTSEKLRFPLMILAALSIAGFVWWLSVFTEPTQFAVAQEENAEEANAAPSLALGTFEQRAGEMVGSRVRLEGMEVATSIGPRAFLTSLPEGTPYVVRLMPAAGDLLVTGGEVMDLVGTVRAMSDDVLDAWEAEGVITDPTARDIAGFGATFLEAEAVTLRAATETPPGGDDDL
ncbi:MAG: hypothetical protein EA350_11960 [Gemmatimonadales bacterium]|nr:MAG: hypothetical protein EA350_11960 [Gemmatimonadales bacterium]